MQLISNTVSVNNIIYSSKKPLHHTALVQVCFFKHGTVAVQNLSKRSEVIAVLDQQLTALSLKVYLILIMTLTFTKSPCKTIKQMKDIDVIQ